MPLILHATLVYTSSALPIFVVFSLTPGYTLHIRTIWDGDVHVCAASRFPMQIYLTCRTSRARKDYVASPRIRPFEGKPHKSPYVSNLIDEISKFPYYVIAYFFIFIAYDCCRSFRDTRENFSRICGNRREEKEKRGREGKAIVVTERWKTLVNFHSFS